MKALDLKIPPPIVTALFAVAMWAISQYSPTLSVDGTVRTSLTAIFVLCAVVFELGGLLSFKKAATTVNPLKPETASSLVTSGIYRITRNPMYVGFLSLLLAWATYLASPWALVCAPIFIIYITRFQIKPEEQALSDIFEDDFEDYKSKVRRWI